MTRITTIFAAAAALCMSTSLALADNSVNTGASETNRKPKPGEVIIKQGDLNHDGQVNFDDLMIIVMNWGDYDWPTPVDIAPEGGDYRVGFDDMMVVLMNWGQ